MQNTPPSIDLQYCWSNGLLPRNVVPLVLKRRPAPPDLEARIERATAKRDAPQENAPAPAPALLNGCDYHPAPHDYDPEEASAAIAETSDRLVFVSKLEIGRRGFETLHVWRRPQP
jgi:hypothetical protein